MDFEKIYQLEEAGYPREAARQIMLVTIDLVDQMRWLDLDLFMTSIDLSKLSPRSMTALVRSTLPFKHYPTWQWIYRQCWQRIESIGKNPDHYFIGMPPPQ